MDTPLPRELPFDVECEQAVLGSMLINPRSIDGIAAEIDAERFYDPLHKRLFEMIVALSGEGAVTPLVVHAVMKRDPGLLEVGGIQYLSGLAAAAPALPNTLALANVLKDLATRRDLIRLGEDMVDAAYEGPRDQPARAIADATTEELLRLGSEARQPVIPAYDIALESLREAEDIASGKPFPAVKTGLAKLDDELGGFRGGDLIIVAGKSGMGKSAFLGALSLNAARAGIPTIVFSLEMMRRQWVERMVCDLDYDTASSPLWYSRIRNGRMTRPQFDRFGTAMQGLADLPFEIHDEDDLTVQQISARARAFKARHGNKMGLVLWDYLQITNPGDTRERSREQVVNSFARGAKSLAKRLGWPVVAGSQMNEGAEARGRDEKRPQASDVRESKGIMNEADIILAPYRQAWYVENRKPTDALPDSTEFTDWEKELDGCRNRMELLALKNRHGRRFDINLHCDMGASAIRDFSPRHTMSDPDQPELAGLVA